MFRNEINDLNNHMKSQKRNVLFQDLQITCFLISVLVFAITIASSNRQDIVEYIILFTVTAASYVFAVYQYKYVATVMTGLQVLIYTVYKVYQLHEGLAVLNWRCFVWVTLPFVGIISLILFLRSSYEMEAITQLLQNQIADMALVNPLTGLYNLKAMYIDLERQMAYVTRRNEKICLAMLEMRYASELKSILTTSQYQQVIQRFAHSVEDSIRLEDRCYSLDEDGAIGIILFCDGPGAEIIKRRIKTNASNTENFYGITERALKIDVRMAYLEYDKEVIHNAIEFKQKTEYELQYDV